MSLHALISFVSTAIWMASTACAISLVTLDHSTTTSVPVSISFPGVKESQNGSVTISVTDGLLRVALSVEIFDGSISQHRTFDFGTKSARLGSTPRGPTPLKFTRAGSGPLIGDGSEHVGIDFPIPGSSASVTGGVDIAVSSNGSLTVRTSAKVTAEAGVSAELLDGALEDYAKISGSVDPSPHALMESCRVADDCHRASFGDHQCTCTSGTCECITIHTDNLLNTAVGGYQGYTSGESDIFF